MGQRKKGRTRDDGTATSDIDRRTFLQGAGVAALAAGTGLATPELADAAITSGTPRVARRGYRRRRRTALAYRVQCARVALARNSPLFVPANNGEEHDYPYVANYSKGLPHDALGHVEPLAYQGLLDAVATGDPIVFESLRLGGTRRLTSPQAGLAFDLEGPDSHAMIMRPAPRIDGAENSSEMAELYWMALARDVPFVAYDTDPTIGFACTDLSHFSAFRGPKVAGQVAPATIFRGSTSGDLAGPFVSQFLLRDYRFGSLTVSQRQQTVLPGIDYLTDFASWLAVQNGGPAASGDAFDPTPRYIRSLRDLGHYVHVDALYQAYLTACLILLDLGVPFDPGLPPATSATQDGFAEWGPPHILSLVTEVATRALKAAWHQKWLVHRRLRPEEFGGRLHNLLASGVPYSIDSEILGSTALARVFSTWGTFLLPQLFPDGCPTHPAYPSGHATVAGACVTVLKAFFDDTAVLPNPVVASADGTALLPYSGPPLTVRDELHKVASNIATGRNAAGIHWRTDFTEGLALGELVALGVLEEQKGCYNQDVTMTLRRFDGTTVQV
jgi:membrane-associated phospholipid phosphatase